MSIKDMEEILSNDNVRLTNEVRRARNRTEACREALREIIGIAETEGNLEEAISDILDVAKEAHKLTNP